MAMKINTPRIFLSTKTRKFYPQNIIRIQYNTYNLRGVVKALLWQLFPSQQEILRLNAKVLSLLSFPCNL